MPNTRSYKELHQQVAERPGAVERLAALRTETLAEIGLYEMRRRLDWSQSGVAAELGISQAAVSQLENAHDLSISRLRKYLEPLGARLQILAVFEHEDEEYSIPICVGRKAS
jgi:predicted transcriptional regulator